MKAIDILQDKANGRPVDRVNEALHPECMPFVVAAQFGDWIAKQMPAHVRSMIDGAGRHFTTIARGYLNDARLALAAEYHEQAYQNVRMLALLHVEVVRFGRAGRRTHRAHLRELLRLCRKHVQDERNAANANQTKKLYSVMERR